MPNDVKTALTTSGRKSLDKSPNRQIVEKTAARAQEGKFVELPGAEMGKVVVRFPPEASG